MPHRYRRTDRVDELLKEEIARVLRDVKDPRVGFVTVMDVEVSPDLRHARVFVSVLGEEAVKLESIEALRRARGWVRARVGEAITLKYLPELHFVLDRTLEKAARIEELIGEMRADVGEPVAAEEATAAENPDTAENPEAPDRAEGSGSGGSGTPDGTAEG